MKYSSIILSFLIISLLLVSSCSKGSSLSESELLKECNEISHERTKWACYSKVALENKDIKICDKIDYINEKIRCHSEIARETKNVKICDDIAEKYSDFSDTCYSYITETLPDPKLCEKIPQIVFRNNCFSKVASKIGDQSICEKIEPDMIMGTPYHQRDGCYSNIAYSKKDISICDKIVDGFQKDICNRQIQAP